MKDNKMLKVGIAGFGVVGKRRKQFIEEHPDLELIAVCDKNFEFNQTISDRVKAFTNYKDLLKENIEIVFVCLTNDIAAEVTIKSLESGRHVFCEKPPGRTVDEIKRVIEVENKTKLLLKYGFNHRYHKSIQMAMELISSKKLGEIVNIRGVYGKSKIISLESGWRSKKEIAGGGILLDQGIHMVDLILLFCSEITDVKSYISNNYWKHDVEDNAYAILKDNKGVVAMLHSSATEWQHKFKMEISLTEGYIELSGILSGSKSYGEETITIGERNANSDVGQLSNHTIKYLLDNSWKDEIYEFVESIKNNKRIVNGNSLQALKTMETVFKIYNSDKSWK